MAKNMKTDIDDNCYNKSNSKGFNKGSEPEKYGPGDDNYGGDSTSHKNVVGGNPNPNGDKNKVYDKKLRTPRDPALNAVPMPNSKKKNISKSVLSYTGDESATYPASADNIIGGTPRPNHIR